MTRSEYNKCVDLYSDHIYRFILHNCKDDELAKDIVQDTFTKSWINRENIDYKKSKSYLFTTAYHTLIDRIRKDKRQTSFDEVDFKSHSHEEHYSDLKEILHEAMQKLPEVQRAVVLLRDYEGYNYKEIGEICNLNESQVKVYIYRARLFLKQYLGSIEKVL